MAVQLSCGKGGGEGGREGGEGGEEGEGVEEGEGGRGRGKEWSVTHQGCLMHKAVRYVLIPDGGEDYVRFQLLCLKIHIGVGSLMFVYTVLSRVSIHSRVSAHPPVFCLVSVSAHASGKRPLLFFSIPAKCPPRFFTSAEPTPAYVFSFLIFAVLCEQPTRRQHKQVY